MNKFMKLELQQKLSHKSIESWDQGSESTSGGDKTPELRNSSKKKIFYDNVLNWLDHQGIRMANPEQITQKFTETQRQCVLGLKTIKLQGQISLISNRMKRIPSFQL